MGSIGQKSQRSNETRRKKKRVFAFIAYNPGKVCLVQKGLIKVEGGTRFGYSVGNLVWQSQEDGRS